MTTPALPAGLASKPPATIIEEANASSYEAHASRHEMQDVLSDTAAETGLASPLAVFYDELSGQVLSECSIYLSECRQAFAAGDDLQARRHAAAVHDLARAAVELNNKAIRVCAIIVDAPQVPA